MTPAEDVGVDEEQKTLVPPSRGSAPNAPGGAPRRGSPPAGPGREQRARGGPGARAPPGTDGRAQTARGPGARARGSILPVVRPRAHGLGEAHGAARAGPGLPPRGVRLGWAPGSPGGAHKMEDDVSSRRGRGGGGDRSLGRGEAGEPAGPPVRPPLCSRGPLRARPSLGRRRPGQRGRRGLEAAPLLGPRRPSRGHGGEAAPRPRGRPRRGPPAPGPRRDPNCGPRRSGS